jgi:hypothetical protein
MTSYDMYPQGFYVTSDCQPEISTSSLYPQSSFTHLTPVSEPCSDIQDCITPLSLQPAFDFNSVQRTAPHPGALNTNLDFIPGRPRSSPSTFGPSNPWTPEHIRVKEEHFSQLTPATSPRPGHRHTTSTTSEPTINPPPVRQYTPIAPNPAGVRQMHSAKRSISSDDELDASPVFKRKRSAPPSPSLSMELTAEDELLLRLKDEENLTWKEIQKRFETDINKTFQIPALQMRLKRLRERMRTWTEMDVQALRMAHDYWHNSKFEIIAAKMTEFGATEKWSPKQCYKKWNEVIIAPDFLFPSHINRTPTFPTSYTSSPVGGPAEGYYPFISSSA